jgi:N-acetylglucosamine-6-phosphate deacetylase
MAGAVKGMIERGRVSLAAAVTMASATPAAFLGLSGQTGTIAAGMRADLVLLEDDYTVRETWIGGEASGVVQPVAAVAR